MFSLIFIGFWTLKILQLFIGGAILSKKFVRRNHFTLRVSLALIGVILVSFPVSYVISTLDLAIYRHMFLNLMGIITIIIVLYMLYKESFWLNILYAITGYALMHINAQINEIIRLITNLDLVDYFFDGRFFQLILMQFLITVPIYLIFYFLFGKKSILIETSESISNSIMLLLMITFIVMILISASNYYADESTPLAIIISFFSCLSGVFFLLLRSGVIVKNGLEHEIELINQLRYKELKHYEQRKEYIDLINIKTHDLKSLIERYEYKQKIFKTSELDEIKNAITFYDTSIKTGNDTIDAILSEKSLYCSTQGIKLSCIIDGEKLNHLSVSEIYSLFGNAVENAIEAVSQIDDEENRIIRINVRENKGMISLVVQNSFRGPLTYKDGLPLTTKKNTKYHGYGLKSIRHVVEKNGGVLTVTADDIFRLSILLPLPK